jgi:putative ABC transport system substrate-binding protein
MRNSFFGLLLSAMILALSLSAEAQQPKKVPRIGYLTLRSAPSDQDEAFKQGLRELGWVDSQNIAIEYRWAAGKVDRLPVLAEELVGLKVDLIVAWATPAVNAAKNATRTIPIVMGPTADPVGSGFVASLSRPGGNITGVSLMAPELAGKRLELLREVVPRLNRIAFLAHGGDPAHTLFVKEAQDAGKSLGVQIQPVVVNGPAEFDGAFLAMTRERAGALVVQPIFSISTEQIRRIVDLAVRNRLPTISDGSQFMEAGGLRLDVLRSGAPSVGAACPHLRR